MGLHPLVLQHTIRLSTAAAAPPAPAPPPPTPVTTQFTSAQVTPGLAGPTSRTLNAAQVRGSASNGGRTVWVGRITGTRAVLQAANIFNNSSGIIDVAVDGGAFALAPNTGASYTLFDGLADTEHVVVWRFAANQGGNAYVPATGNILAVTGVAPAIAPVSNWYQPGEAGVLTASALIAQTTGFLPAFAPRHSSNTYGGNPSSLVIRGNFTRLTLVGVSRFFFVSRNGSAPTVIDTTNAANITRVAELTVPAGEATYYCWDGGQGASDAPSVFAVGTNAPAVALSGVARAHHFGHSIVSGVGASSRGHTDMMRHTGPRNGVVTGQFGTGGNTIAQLLARLPAVLAALTVSAGDTAILDIGQNDGPVEPLTTQEQADYNALIDALLAKGYSKVLALAVYTAGTTDPANINGSISGLITARGNAAVVFVPRTNYTARTTGGTINAPDNIHPDDVGYQQMNALNETAIDPFL